MANTIIRKETKQDYEQIHNLVLSAFSSAEHSDGEEHILIDRLRNTPEYIPELSLVATADEAIVGHLMMSACRVDTHKALALAPVAVLPAFQKRGIGSLMIQEAHKIAGNLGFGISIVLGSPHYYSKFGYITDSEFRIFPPLEVPEEYFMATPLNKDSIIPSGIVKYSSAFNLINSSTRVVAPTSHTAAYSL